MTYENGPGARPEYFEAARNLGEVLSEYNNAARELVVDHDSSLLHLFGKHDIAMRDEREQPGTIPIQQRLTETRSLVIDKMVHTGTDVQKLVEAAAETIPGMLGEEDQRLLRMAKMAVMQEGVESSKVSLLLEQASSRKARKAMRAAMDRQVLDRVQTEARQAGVGSRKVHKMLKYASTSQIKSAMHATLDTSVFIAAQNETMKQDLAMRFGKGRLILNFASSNSARVGMMAGLDATVLRKADATNTPGFYGRLTSNVLRNASSRSARMVLMGQAKRNFKDRQLARLADQERQRRARQQQQSTRNPFDFEGIGNIDEFLARALIQEMLRRQAAGGWRGAAEFGASGRYDRRQTPNFDQMFGGGGTFTTRESAAPRPVSEVERVVSHVVLRNKNYGWLQSERPEDIQRVINTVRQMRQKAAEKGKELPDAKVYRKYRMQGGMEPDNPRLQKSLAILDALMLGDVDGELPF